MHHIYLFLWSTIAMSVLRVVMEYRRGCELFDADLLHLHLRTFCVDYVCDPCADIIIGELFFVREKSEQEMIQALEALDAKEEGLLAVEDILCDFFVARASDIAFRQTCVVEH